jgi:putative hemolysin
MTFDLLFLFLLLVANGVFAMAEIALVASRSVRLEQRVLLGDPKAARALRLKGNPTDFLSTVQVGITLIGILAGAYSGSTLAEPLAALLQSFPAIGPYSETLAFAIVVSLLTYFSLVIGELVPKAIALREPERLAAWVAVPFDVIARVAAPLVRLLSVSTNVVLWLLRIRPGDEPHPTEEEIRALIKQAAYTGELEPAEQQLVEKVFHLGDRRVSSLMTPRHEVEWIDANADAAEIRTALASQRRSCYVVCDGELDQVIGVALAQELLAQCLTGPSVDLRVVIRAPLFVPDTLSALTLLERFRTAHTETGVVVDEYGGIQGLVTITDILEGLFGALPNTPATDSGPIVRRSDGSWLVDGAVSLDDLRAHVPLPRIPEEDIGQYETLAGLVMTRLSRVPHVGDRVTWESLLFEVVDMDGRRVDKVLITPVAASPHASAPANL